MFCRTTQFIIKDNVLELTAEASCYVFGGGNKAAQWDNFLLTDISKQQQDSNLPNPSTNLSCSVCCFRDSPTKLDREVLSAVEATDIDPLKFPSIQKWKSTMQTYTSSDMQRYACLHAYEQLSLPASCLVNMETH